METLEKLKGVALGLVNNRYVQWGAFFVLGLWVATWTVAA